MSEVRSAQNRGVDLLRDHTQIQLADGPHTLRYDFAAWALLEELQGSFEEALVAGWSVKHQGASFHDLAVFVAAGLAHERAGLTHSGLTQGAVQEVASLLLPLRINEYQAAVAEALQLAEFEPLDDLTEDQEGTGWDWDRALYMVTGAIGRTEAEFWAMTPKRFSRLVRGYLLFHKLPDTDGGQEQPQRRNGLPTEAEVMSILGAAFGGG